MMSFCYTLAFEESQSKAYWLTNFKRLCWIGKLDRPCRPWEQRSTMPGNVWRWCVGCVGSRLGELFDSCPVAHSSPALGSMSLEVAGTPWTCHRHKEGKPPLSTLRLWYTNLCLVPPLFAPPEMCHLRAEACQGPLGPHHPAQICYHRSTSMTCQAP